MDFPKKKKKGKKEGKENKQQQKEFERRSEYRMGMVWQVCSFGCMRLRKGSMNWHRSRWPRPCTYVTVTSAALLTPDNRHPICPDDKV